MKKMADTIDFFVFPLTLEATNAAEQLKIAEEQAANQVPATIPHGYLAGRARRMHEPSMGINVSPMDV